MSNSIIKRAYKVRLVPDDGTITSSRTIEEINEELSQADFRPLEERPYYGTAVMVVEYEDGSQEPALAYYDTEVYLGTQEIVGHDVNYLIKLKQQRDYRFLRS